MPVTEAFSQRVTATLGSSPSLPLQSTVAVSAVNNVMGDQRRRLLNDSRSSDHGHTMRDCGLSNTRTKVIVKELRITAQ